jgi:CNT family concentrative nucleoside transporter
MSILYYWGLMQLVVKWIAKLMQWTLGTSGAETLSAAANIFVGHTEAPLVVRPYISAMTLSELNAMMVGGFATISGGLLAAYSGMGISPGHLITASVISAPAALLIAKVMQPEVGTPQTRGNVSLDLPRRGVNVIEAAAIGASEGMKLAINVAAMLIAFLALIAMCDAILGWLGDALFGFRDAYGNPTLTLARILGYAFWPLAFLMGIEFDDCLPAGELLGIKMVANEFIAYQRMGEWIAHAEQSPATRLLSERSTAILTYALCGFSNFGAIGIQIGGIGGLAPERRSDLAKLGLRAMLGGTLACCMTACVASTLI